MVTAPSRLLAWSALPALAMVGACGHPADPVVVGTSPPAMVVACATYNVGSPDRAGGRGESLDPLVLAQRWAADRYPGVRPGVDFKNSDDAYVVFDQTGGARQAVLHYQDDGEGWYLEGLAYC